MTTNNHPAHGPISLDRLHRIREILSKASAQSDGGNLGYAMADAVKVIDGAIAAFGAEPVAYIFKHPAGRLFWSLTDESNKRQSDVMPVYADPVPSFVPPAISVIYKDGWPEPNSVAPIAGAAKLPDGVHEFYAAPPAPVVPWAWQQWIADAAEYLEGGLEADGELEAEGSIEAKRLLSRRAAMLQAGNSPVTPDCWIPVSKRIPDKLIPVMVMYEDGEMWSAMWNGNSWDDGTEYPDPHEVTHWREMPAAPHQEVK